MRTFTEKRRLGPKNVALLHMISKNLDLHVGFSEKEDLTMKNVDLYLNLKMWIVIHHFLKKMDLYLRNVDL